MLAAGLAVAGAVGAAEPAAPAAPPKPYVIPANVPKYVRDAVESRYCTPAMTARDFDRKPAERPALSGVKPGDRAGGVRLVRPVLHHPALPDRGREGPDLHV